MNISNEIFIPNEILNIIFSYVERSKYINIMKELILNYNKFTSINPTPNIPNSNPTFPTYFFRLFFPIWRRWPENFPSLFPNKFLKAK